MQLLTTILTRLVRSDALVNGEPVAVTHLLSTAAHSPPQSQQRARLILTRARQIAVLLAALTLIWILVDAAVLPNTLWPRLAAMRLFASAAFIVLAMVLRQSVRLNDARRALAALLLIPTVFYLLAQTLLTQSGHPAANLAVHTAYELLPFIVVAGLSIFPLTALESLLYTFPVLLAKIGVGLMQHQLSLDIDTIGAIWLLMLLALTVMLASMSQLQFMLALTNQSLHDPLTGCYNRGSGEQFLELQFSIATRQQAPLALAFIDIDDFKSINDRYGHDIGDTVLRHTADVLHNTLRAGDILLRWGGEEFVVLMPNVGCAAAQEAFARLHAGGLGERPDGKPLTVSVGIAERRADATGHWRVLVEQADQRMYEAKRGGKNRCVACHDP